MYHDHTKKIDINLYFLVIPIDMHDSDSQGLAKRTAGEDLRTRSVASAKKIVEK